MSLTDQFRDSVVEPLELQHPERGSMSLRSYLDTPPDGRTGDEADVVDARFTPALLKWLGYEPQEWVYNRNQGEGRRPDFRVSLFGTTVFIVEDKATPEEFGVSSLAQIKRYVAGTRGLAIWTNACRIVALRVSNSGDARVLCDFDALGEEIEHGLASLRNAFAKDRFSGIDSMLREIAVGRGKWRPIPLDSDRARRDFVQGARTVLVELSQAAGARLVEARNDLRRLNIEKRALEASVDRAFQGFRAASSTRPEPSRREAAKLSDRFWREPTPPPEEEFVKELPAAFDSPAELRTWRDGCRRSHAALVRYQEHELLRLQSKKVISAFEVWAEQHRAIENDGATDSDRDAAFSEQVGYTFFARLLLARILEDMGLVHRLVSNGGLKSWLRTVGRFLSLKDEASATELHGEQLVSMVFSTVARFYRHFFAQPVFDWFQPDDFQIALSLRLLGRYSFKDLSTDILGYTYESYIDATARSKKGHFLTPPRLVEHVLDLAGYSGASVAVSTVLDPAAGSGSFLVAAARRLLRAIKASEPVRAKSDPAARRVEVAQRYLSAIQELLVGFEINPFSCYLAELNLFVQALPHIHVLWKETRTLFVVDRFRVYNTNALKLPRSVLTGNLTVEGEGLERDEAREAKLLAGGFDFVVGNPPYVNRGKVLGVRSYRDFSFYSDVLEGDENLFLLFIRLATHFVSESGTMALVVPLNLLGDRSAKKARGVLHSERHQLAAITRFYRRDVLFQGVLQRVCAFVAHSRGHEQFGRKHIEVRGGRTIEEAKRNKVRVLRRKVVEATPDVRDQTWHRAWLAVPEQAQYPVWSLIKREGRTSLSEISRGKLVFQQGDVNVTRTRVFRVTEPGVGRVPLAKAQGIEDFGPWEPDVWLEPSIDPRTKGLTGKSLRDAERERLQRVMRVLALETPETVFALKDIAGLEAVRPIRGAAYWRSAETPFLFGHTVQVCFPTSAKWNQLAWAMFGFLTSVVPNYVLQLFSTNAHVTKEELERTPMPLRFVERAPELSRLAQATQAAGEDLARLRALYGCSANSDRMDPAAVLREIGCRSVTLEALTSAGALRVSAADLPRPPRWLGEVDALVDNTALASALRILFERPERIDPASARTPHPDAALSFVGGFESAAEAISDARHSLDKARASTDCEVLSLYRIDRIDHIEAVYRGVGWAVEGRAAQDRVCALVLEEKRSPPTTGATIT